MLKRRQIIGATVPFRHHPFRSIAEKASAIGFDRMKFRGIAPHLDQADEA
jgi:hypothetical protein